MSHHSRKIAGVLLFVLLSAGAVYWTLSRRENSPVSHREAATRVLAEHLQEKHSPQTVLVISNPFAETSGRPQEVYDFQNAALAGLEKGFGKNVEVTKAPAALKAAAQADPGSVPIDPASKTPLSFLIEENAFDQLIQQYPKAEIVVSLIGLPVNLAKCEGWQNEGPPKFALLLPDWRMIGDRNAILRAFASGKLLAAVVEQGSALPAQEGSGNHLETFENRFVLITPENVQRLLQEQPKLFAL